MACSISLTADMAGEGTEWRSPIRHPLTRSATAALIDEPPISTPIACRGIPRYLEAIVVHREESGPGHVELLCPSSRGAYDTDTTAPTWLLHALSGRQEKCPEMSRKQVKGS